MERPEGCRFWTADDIVNWIDANVPSGKTGQAEAAKTVDAALWWLAYESAMALVDSNTTKEWAEMLLEGFPGLDREDLDAECQNPHLDEEHLSGAGAEDKTPVQELDGAIEKRLYDFFLRGA